MQSFVIVVQSLSHVQLFAAPWTAACHSSLSFTSSQSLLKFKSTESVMQPNHLVLYSPLLLLPSFFLASGSFLMSWSCIRWPNYWSFSFSVTPSNECSGLIYFRIDWLDLLAVQGTLKSLLQQHSSSVLQCSAFMV